MVIYAADIFLVLAVITNGLLAGLFVVFTVAISPGLRRVDDGAYVRAFRAINTAILNGWFLTIFLTAPLFAIASTVFHPWGEGPASLSLLLLGSVCSLVTLGITVGASVPLNQRLDRAPIDTDQQFRAARQFFETRWNNWNLVRTLTSTAAFVSFVLASG